jgi:hypothetical protein
MRIRIEGRDLPGGASYVGLQVGKVVEQIHPADVPVAVWTAAANLVARPEEAPDLRGPAIHGKPGDRFLYLSWSRLVEGEPVMFRRAKLMLDSVDAATLKQAAAEGQALVARLGLTAKDGTPRCAAVRPPDITWTAEAD